MIYTLYSKERIINYLYYFINKYNKNENLTTTKSSKKEDQRKIMKEEEDDRRPYYKDR